MIKKIANTFRAIVRPVKNTFLGYGHTVDKTPVKGLIAYKVNYFMNSTDGGIVLSPYNYSSTYTNLNDEADCVATSWNNNHFQEQIPVWDCSCGFYAYKSAVEAFGHDEHSYYTNNSYVLEVVISGKYIEYEKGYRYAHQRVQSVIVSNCFEETCYAAATCFVESSPEKLGNAFMSSRGNYFPSCKKHMLKFSPKKRLTFEQFGLRLSKEVAPKHKAVTVKSLHPNLKPLTAKEVKKKSLKQFFKYLNVNRLLDSLFY